MQPVTDTATPFERIAAALESIAGSLAVIAARDPSARLQPVQQPTSYRTVSAPRG